MRILIVLAAFATALAGSGHAATETIHSVAHVKRGREAEYAQLSAK